MIRVDLSACSGNTLPEARNLSLAPSAVRAKSSVIAVDLVFQRIELPVWLLEQLSFRHCQYS